MFPPWLIFHIPSTFDFVSNDVLSDQVVHSSGVGILTGAESITPHERLQSLIQTLVNQHGKALIVDFHVFAATSKVFSQCQNERSSQICIGTHGFHSPAWLVDRLEDAFWQQGFSVEVRQVPAHRLLPLGQFEQDQRVMSVKIKVREDCYLDQSTGQRRPEFDRITVAMRPVFVSLLE